MIVLSVVAWWRSLMGCTGTRTSTLTTNCRDFQVVRRCCGYAVRS